MRYKLTVSRDYVLPNNRALVAALVNGVKARQTGQPAAENPYEADTAPGFYQAWYHGWKGSGEGQIQVEEPETRQRV